MACKNQNFLNDDWEIQGNDLESFYQELKKMDEKTEIRVVPMDEMAFLSVNEKEAYPLQSAGLWKKTKCAISLKKYPFDPVVYQEKGYDDVTIQESVANGLYMTETKKKLTPAKIKKIMENGNYIPVSEMAIGTIANRIKYFGNGFFNDHLIRDLAIAKNFNKPIPVTIIKRKEGSMEKLFAVMSDKYTAIPQSTMGNVISQILDLAEGDLGKGICAGWFLNHSLTRIYLEFPEAGKEMKDLYELPEEMIPGILLETSDVGDCSFRMKGYFRMRNSVNFMEEEFGQMHTGEISLENIRNEIETKIFPKYTWYPERLADLMGMDLLEEGMTEAKRIRTMSSLYRKISRHIGLVKAIGKNREKNLIDQMIDSINPEIDYTAYDVAMQFLTLADCVETESRITKDLIAKVSFSVLSYEFEEKEEELFLVS